MCLRFGEPPPKTVVGLLVGGRGEAWREMIRSYDKFSVGVLLMIHGCLFLRLLLSGLTGNTTRLVGPHIKSKPNVWICIPKVVTDSFWRNGIQTAHPSKALRLPVNTRLAGVTCRMVGGNQRHHSSITYGTGRPLRTSN